ncbi:hypothetical protein Ancab_028397 [Ancistrocladus abbreviatus]
MLISITLPSPILGSVPVVVEGSSFMVTVFEESIGESIFSRGLDQLRVTGENYQVNKDANATTNVGCCCSEIQCFLVGNMVNEGLALLEMNISSGRMVDSKVLHSNDDRQWESGGLKQCHQQETIRQDLAYSRTTGAFDDGYMSSTRKTLEGALMADGSGPFVRREEMASTTGFKLVNQGFKPRQED